ncbi:N-acylneuraminate-9-phosphatase isoform X3 [Lycorma delicatula]|uniref:N-acylneuraminate-9-phosphatase isoform X3 n=1 Tax=Lycorma delicatula TaxID=130591 RepID=UPI003F517B0F
MEYVRRPLESVNTIFFDLDNTLIPTRQGDKLTREKIAELLSEKYSFPTTTSESVSQTFLENFCKCPDNPKIRMDNWHVSLWRNALPENYKFLAASDVFRETFNGRFTLQMNACESLGVSPNNCVMVGDKIEVDIAGGIASGLAATFWVKLKYNYDSESYNCDIQPDYILDSVTELPSHLPLSVCTSALQSSILPCTDLYFTEGDSNNNSSTSDRS